MDFKRLGKYEIAAKIGQGAMGEVFRAHDPVLGRDVAIKTMSAGVGSDDELRKRFHREAQSAGRLNHPNIITVHDFGEEQGHIFMAMELLEGDDLKDLITRQTPLSLAQKFSLMEQIADGLAFAHTREVVHRDLKPANIHILPGGQVKIMDFGLARIASSDMTRAGVIMGTPNYMSPEQVRGEKATARSDVFSLGAVFYELLGGRKPFDADSLAAILYQVMQVHPEPLEEMRPDLPPELCGVVTKAMAKDASRRYANGGELREALRQIHDVVVRARTAEGLFVPPPAEDPARTVVAPPSPTTKRGTLTRVAPESGEATRVSRDATALKPSAPSPETLVERQPTLSGKTSTQVPTAGGARQRPSDDRTELVMAPRAERPSSSRAFAYAGGALVVAAGVAALVYFRVHPPPAQVSPLPTPNLVAPPPGTPAVALGGLRASLGEKDYRTAVARGREILRVDPQNDEARRGVDQAERALHEIEATAARVKDALDVGDAERASRALAALSALDPLGSDTKALTTRFADAGRVRAQESRLSMEAARRDAQRRSVGPSELASAEAVAAEGDRALGVGDFATAARSFAQARDAFQRAQRTAVTPTPAVVHPSVAPSPVAVTQNPPQNLPIPPPVTALSPAAAVVPQLSEAATKQAIRGVLDEYRQSFENRNADALRTVQPGIDYDQMKQTFAAVTAFGVRLEVGDVIVTGATATARCLVTYSPVPKPAGRTKPVPTVFHLKKTGDLWLIERLERVEK